MSDVRLKHKKKINVDLSEKVRIVYPRNHSDLYGLGFDESGHIGFQRELTDENKLNADLVDDTNSSNKFTNSQEKTKLAGIESGAQVNIIEQISVNGVPAQVDANKNVNLTILLEAGVKLTYVAATGVLSLLDKDNNVLSSVDLPLELLIQRGYYDSTNKNIVLVLANQDTIVIPVADLFTDLASLSGDNTFTGENTFDNDAYFNGTTTFNWEIYCEDFAYFRRDVYVQSDIEIDGNMNVSGDIYFYGNSIEPSTTQTKDLGTSRYLWRTLYAANVSDGNNTLAVNNIASKDYVDSQFLSDNEMATLLEEVFN